MASMQLEDGADHLLPHNIGFMYSDETLKFPSSHQHFLIPEIVGLVFKEIEGKERQQTLFSLALTCRSFREPALDLLWYTLRSLMPLIKCMPPDLWESKSARRKGILALERPIFSTDWPRFREHAQRVRVFIGEDHKDSYIGQEVYQALDTAAESKTLFSKLKTLNWSESDDHIFPFIRLFLGPNIRDLGLLLDGSPQIRLSLLPTLVSRCPGLTTLALQAPNTKSGSGMHMQMISSSMTSCIHDWHLLRGLITTGGIRVTPEALTQLASFPDLKNLFIEATFQVLPVNFPRSPGALAFPCIRQLGIKSKYLDLCTSLIKSISSRALTEINVHTRDSRSSRLREFFVAVQENCTQATLDRISISDGSSSNDEDQCSLHDIDPLFGFFALTTVKITFSRSFEISDQGMKSLALAWPQITMLSLKSHTLSRQVPSLTLQGLIPLAEYCKRLEDLTIPFNALIVPSRRLLREVYNPSLVQLSVVNSPISDPRAVAAFLTGIFPKIKLLENHDKEHRAGNQPESVLDRKWTEVEGFLEIFVAIRAEERERWAPKDTRCS